MQGAYYQEAMGMKGIKNVNPFSVQKAHKPVRAGQYLRSLQRRIVPSMEIRVYSWLFLARTMVALMQGAYYQEVMSMKSLKM